jgi:hypothetical protein
VCGLDAHGAPRCAGPILTEKSSTRANCYKDPDCRKRPDMTVELHCRASVRGDSVTVERDPAKIENFDDAALTGPTTACTELPWAGTHTLAF